MPELPEVECVRQTLEPAVVGRTISEVEIAYEKAVEPSVEDFTAGVTGRTIAGTDRHGKLLILNLDNGAILAIHLRMTGQVILAQNRPEADHIHVRLGLDTGMSVFYRDMRKFGRLTYCPDQAALAAGPLANMGPDALGLGQDDFCERVGARGGKLKNVILDQRVLSGVGNIYADECLHRACLSPVACPKDLPRQDLQRLHGHLIKTLQEALAKGGSSIRNFMDAEGRAGTFQHSHRVYRRTGQPCPVCGSEIQRIVLAGRSTHYCPRCQKS